MFKKLRYKIKKFFKWLFLVDHQITLGRITLSLKGMKWELHPFDRDCNPSVPHLHCVEDKNIKINIYNGEIYDDGLNIGKLKDKEFNALWHDKTFLKLVKQSRDFYSKEYPNYRLVDIPFVYSEIDKNVIITFDSVKQEILVTYKNDKGTK